MDIPKLLIIAGSDSGGGAGIQADLKVCNALGVHGMTAITAITAQNPCRVDSIYPVEAAGVVAQVRTVGEVFDITHVKLGMLFNTSIISALVEELKNRPWKLVVDPVMVATSGARLLEEEAIDCVVNQLLPLAEVITPNIPEAEILYGQSISDVPTMVRAAKALSRKYQTAVVLKGGHGIDDELCDVLAYEDSVEIITAKRVQAKGTHGTGCTLSSAIASFLAKGESIKEAVFHAVGYVRGAIFAEKKLGKDVWGLGLPQELADDMTMTSWIEENK